MLPAWVPIAPDAIGREVWLVRQGKLLFRENEEEMGKRVLMAIG